MGSPIDVEWPVDRVAERGVCQTRPVIKLLVFAALFCLVVWLGVKMIRGR